MNRCIICDDIVVTFKDSQFQYDYDYCKNCYFIKKNAVLNPTAEKQEYKRHNNTLDNESYVKYWQELIDNCFLKYISREMNILDFGSGPFPILQAVLLKYYNIDVDIYDLYFASNKFYKKKQYDVIFLTEVIEHIGDPLLVLSNLMNNLTENGTLIIMTLLHNNDQDIFNNWWYRRDPTHISFFHSKTFEIIALELQLKIEYSDDSRIIILNKHN